MCEKFEQIKSFYELAVSYCQFVKSTEISEDMAESILILLSKLVYSVMELPEIEPDTTESSKIEISGIKLNICCKHTYWDMFNPFDSEDIVCGDLADDLTDIYRDLKRGINEYESGKLGNAVFEWKLGFRTYWGKHTTDAMKILYWMYSQTN